MEQKERTMRMFATPNTEHIWASQNERDVTKIFRGLKFQWLHSNFFFSFNISGRPIETSQLLERR